MNRTFTKLILLAAVVFSAACSDDNPSGVRCDMIWDFYPMNITFKVSDAGGHDLLDPEYDKNILEDISVKYRGNTYVVDEPGDTPFTRAYMPHWHGLHTRYSKDEECLLLYFGEFSPSFYGSHKDDKLTIDWGDGTKDKVTFDFYVTYKDCAPIVTKRIFLNGKSTGEIIEVKK